MLSGPFHHHKDENSQLPANPNQPINYPAQPVSTQPGGRLFPLGVFTSRSAKHTKNYNPASVMTPLSTQAPGRQTNKPTVDNSTTINALSPHTVPLNFAPTNTQVKIGIGLNLQTARLSVLDGAQLIDNSNGQVIANLPGQSQWLLSQQEDHLVLQPKKEYYSAIDQLAGVGHTAFSSQSEIEPTVYHPDSPVYSDLSHSNWQTNQSLAILNLPALDAQHSYTLKPVANQDQAGLLALNDHSYRGSFLIQKTIGAKANSSAQTIVPKNFNIINSLTLEDYLFSVVPSEMPSLWPDEALKAQAIAARSYAVANLGKHGSNGYDLKDNTEDQMYLGVKSETQASNQAVNSTKGLIIRYDGKPICAYFHSASGGNTELAEHVWSKSLPYLKAVVDFDQEFSAV